MKEVYLRPCPCCGGPAMMGPDIEFSNPNTIINERIYTVRCKDFFGCGVKISKAINELEPEYEDRINDLVDQWNRRPEVSFEDIKAYCDPRSYLVVAAELFYKLSRGLMYRLDQLPIDGVGAYTIDRENGTLKICIQDGTINDGRLGRCVIVEEEPSHNVEVFHSACDYDESEDD